MTTFRENIMSCNSLLFSKCIVVNPIIPTWFVSFMLVNSSFTLASFMLKDTWLKDKRVSDFFKISSYILSRAGAVIAMSSKSIRSTEDFMSFSTNLGKYSSGVWQSVSHLMRGRYLMFLAIVENGKDGCPLTVRCATRFSARRAKVRGSK